MCILMKMALIYCYLVSLYHDGDSDSETIALSSDDDDDMNEKYN